LRYESLHVLDIGELRNLRVSAFAFGQLYRHRLYLSVDLLWQLFLDFSNCASIRIFLLGLDHVWSPNNRGLFLREVCNLFLLWLHVEIDNFRESEETEAGWNLAKITVIEIPAHWLLSDGILFELEL